MAAKLDLPVIYLAGPITHVGEEERVGWRTLLKDEYSDRYEFRDPMDRQPEGDRNSESFAQQVAEYERVDILCSDAVLAYLPQDSMGTAMGMMYAWLSDRLVVVVTPERRLSPLVRALAHRLYNNLEDAFEALDQELSSGGPLTITDAGADGQVVGIAELAERYDSIIERYVRTKSQLDGYTPPNASIFARATYRMIRDITTAHGIPMQTTVRELEDTIGRVLMHNSHHREVIGLARSYIADQRVEETRRAAEQDARDNEEFFRSFLHDLKSPAGNIKRNGSRIARLIESGQYDDTKPQLRAIEANADRILNSSHSLRTELSERYQVEHFPLAAVVSKVFDPEKLQGNTLRLDVAEDLQIRTSRFKMERILVNFREDGLKHGFPVSEERGCFYVSAHVEKNGEDVMIEVYNDGVPISQPQVDSIFEPKSGDGSPLSWGEGMLTVKRFVEQMGGTISCDVHPDKAGPWFKIYLRHCRPLRKKANRRVLVVDDDDLARNDVQELLHFKGIEAISVRSVDEALSELESNQFTGAVLDVDLQDPQGRDGIWLADMIKSQHHGIRVVVVSGSSKENWQQLAKEKGAVAALEKSMYGDDQLVEFFL